VPIYHGIRAIHGDRYNFRMAALPVTLGDKYTLASGRVYMNGTQALVRLAMMQRERDRAGGLNTARFLLVELGLWLGGRLRRM
jgi:indolepyruvate ferredoxin oxidoreductase